jgi:hypothetical protein
MLSFYLPPTKRELLRAIKGATRARYRARGESGSKGKFGALNDMSRGQLIAIYINIVKRSNNSVVEVDSYCRG